MKLSFFLNYRCFNNFDICFKYIEKPWMYRFFTIRITHEIFTQPLKVSENKFSSKLCKTFPSSTSIIYKHRGSPRKILSTLATLSQERRNKKLLQLKWQVHCSAQWPFLLKVIWYCCSLCRIAATRREVTAWTRDVKTRRSVEHSRDEHGKSIPRRHCQWGLQDGNDITIGTGKVVQFPTNCVLFEVRQWLVSLATE